MTHRTPTMRKTITITQAALQKGVRRKKPNLEEVAAEIRVMNW